MLAATKLHESMMTYDDLIPSAAFDTLSGILSDTEWYVARLINIPLRHRICWRDSAPDTTDISTIISLIHSVSVPARRLPESVSDCVVRAIGN